MKPRRERVLIVDDDEEILSGLSDWFEKQGFEVVTASNGLDGLRRVRADGLDLVMLDIQMPGMDGMSVLHRIKQEELGVTVVVMTAYASVEYAVRAMQAGAFDFIPKPFDVERMRVVVDKAMERERLRRENRCFREAAARPAPPPVGESPKMREVLEVARKAARSSATLLLLGESGTGKEVLARAIHRWSPRRDRPFVAVNCVALVEPLLESELFGHEKGAFTGAVQRKTGKFETARGGTILLDEVGAMKPDSQLKLLRVLQEGEFERVGGAHTIKADVRIIAATNRNLERAIAEGTFLEDLYYRLNVVSLVLPPLRERKEDISALARCFLHKYAQEIKQPVETISEAAMACLTAYAWPGNVRELENAIERAVVLNTGPEILPRNLPNRITGGANALHSRETMTARVDEWLRAMIRQERGDAVRSFIETLEEMALRVAVDHTGGNKSKAARLLGINRKWVERRMKKYSVIEAG